jgi:hypothetical protein
MTYEGRVSTHSGGMKDIWEEASGKALPVAESNGVRDLDEYRTGPGLRESTIGSDPSIQLPPRRMLHDDDQAVISREDLLESWPESQNCTQLQVQGMDGNTYVTLQFSLL